MSLVWTHKTSSGMEIALSAITALVSIHPRVYKRDTGPFVRTLTADCCRAERAATRFGGL